MVTRTIATTYEITTAQNSFGNWLYTAGSVQQFNTDYNTLKWKDFKTKYQSYDKNGKSRITNQTNFDALVRKTYRTLELSQDKKDRERGFNLRIIYSGQKRKKLPSKQQTKVKYPYRFTEYNGKNSAYCSIQKVIHNYYQRTNIENYDLDVSYAQEDSATMLYNAFQKYKMYVGSDILQQNTIGNRFTIMLHTNQYDIPYSSNRTKYTSYADLWKEIEDKLVEMIIAVISAKFVGLEVFIESVM